MNYSSIHGIHKSIRFGYEVSYDSTWELVMFLKFDSDPNILSYKREPFHINYIFNNKKRKYFPDLLVTYMNCSKELIEIKPASQCLDPLNIAKWDAARRFCQLRNIRFVVLTEKEIFKKS